MNPRVGQSVDRVYELAGLYADITVDAARRLIGIWRDADPPDLRTAKHAALWQDAVEQARTALSDITRRVPAPRRESPAVHPGDRPGDRAFGTDRR
jgi:cell wall assembly regulator SMI1